VKVRTKVQLIGLGSLDFLSRLFLSVGLLQALLLILASPFGGLLSLVSTVLSLEKLVLGAVLGCHPSHLHRLHCTIDDLVALLEHSDVPSELVAIVSCRSEAHSHDKVVDATLEGENFLYNLWVGLLEAVELGLLGVLHFVLYELVEEGEALEGCLLLVIRNDRCGESCNQLSLLVIVLSRFNHIKLCC